jgi:hypothetical protein
MVFKNILEESCSIPQLEENLYCITERTLHKEKHMTGQGFGYGNEKNIHYYGQVRYSGLI